MKKQVLSLLMVVCLLFCMMPGTALAEDGNTVWKLKDATDVTSYEAMLAALPDGENEPDSDNIIWIEHARLTRDLALAEGQDITTLGKLDIPSGVTLTIGSGTSVTAEVEIQNGGAVIVQDGGRLATTMAGEDAIHNFGELTVEQGAELRTQFGGHVVNEKDAVLNLNGTFYCACIKYGEWDEATQKEGPPTDHIWFANRGTVNGTGDLILFDIGAGPEGRDTVDLDGMIGTVMDLLGQEKRFENWDDVNIFKQVDIYGEEDAAYSAFRAAFTGERTVRGETVEGNMDTIIVLHSSITIPEDDSLSGMIRVIADAGTSVDIAGSLTAGMEIREGRTDYEWNEEKQQDVPIELEPAEVTVEPFGRLATTMGGPIRNSGRLIVKPSGVIESQMGGEIINASGAELQLGGLCYAGGFAMNEEQVGVWFTSEGTIKGYDTENGTKIGHIVMKRIAVPGENAVDTVNQRIKATNKLKTQITGDNVIPVFTTAVDFAEIQALNKEESVDGIYLNGTTAYSDVEGEADLPGGTDGIALMGMSDESLKAVAQIHVTEDLSLVKKLCADWADLIVDKGSTLTLSDMNALSFVARRSRIVVEAPDVSETAGGTLTISSTKIISGDSGENAVFTVTGNIMSLGAAEWAMSDYPASGKHGAWYYVHNGETTGSINAAGTVSEDIILALLADGALNITGDFTYPGSVEIRKEITAAPGASVNIYDLDYGTDSAESDIRGTHSTIYELDFDLNTDSGEDDFYRFLAYRGDRVYLDENDVPAAPERSGYKFAGWKAESGWTGAATADELSAFTVQKDETGRDFVLWPQKFPVIMKAQWTYDGERPFLDVPENAWFFKAVYHCFSKNYFKGTSENGFSPQATMTRAMFATVLYRIAGEPEVTGSNIFNDVKAEQYYTNPITWAAGKNILGGYGDGVFGTNDPVTREQMVTIFWRYKGSPSAGNTDLSGYTDAGRISGYARDAFAWAVGAGVISGKGNGVLDPQGKATRAEVAQIVTNYDQKVK